jgi:hypothetical protein
MRLQTNIQLPKREPSKEKVDGSQRIYFEIEKLMWRPATTQINGAYSEKLMSRITQNKKS